MSGGFAPEVRPAASAGSNARLRLLAARGDPTDISIFSGIPHHFLKAAMEGGIIDGPVPLPRDGLGFSLRRIVWNATRPLTGDRHGGYQYWPARRNRQWAEARSMLAGSCILNHWQLYPKWVVDDDSIEKWYFMDQSLTQLYDDYGERKIIGRRIAQSALAEERAGYEAARGIIVQSRWAAASIINDYGIAPDRVHVVNVAANIDARDYAAWEESEQARRDQDVPTAPVSRPLRLVFVGLDGKRKGLDRLLRGLAMARRDGSGVTLRVIGCTPDAMPAELRSVPGVEWCGRVKKQPDSGLFLRLVSECDIGCLLSVVEAAGAGLWEYQALGLGVLGTNAGGAQDQLLPDTSVVVDVHATDEDVADTLMRLERAPDLVHRMREAAWRQRRSAMWSARVEDIRALWSHPAPRHQAV